MILLQPRIALLALPLVGLASAARGEDFDRAPINYSSSKPDNLVTRLQSRIDRGRSETEFHR